MRMTLSAIFAAGGGSAPHGPAAAAPGLRAGPSRAEGGGGGSASFAAGRGRGGPGRGAAAMALSPYVQAMQELFRANTRSREFPAHGAKVHSVAWSCCGRRLASGSFDKTASVFLLEKDRLVSGAWRERGGRSVPGTAGRLEWPLGAVPGQPSGPNGERSVLGLAAGTRVCTGRGAPTRAPQAGEPGWSRCLAGCGA